MEREHRLSTEDWNEREGRFSDERERERQRLYTKRKNRIYMVREKTETKKRKSMKERQKYETGTVTKVKHADGEKETKKYTEIMEESSINRYLLHVFKEIK